MQSIRKRLIYIRRHLDFLILDLITFTLAYFLSVQWRRSLDIRITHAELFMKFGVVCVAVFLVVELTGLSLDGILSRSLPREAESLALELLLSWSIYTAILFMLKEAHDFSRAIYVSTYFVCFLSLLVVRTVWKGVVRYSRLKESISPKLLVICEASRAQTALSRVLPGSFENLYEISGVILNGNGTPDYKDWYPHSVGLEHIAEYLRDNRIQDAYIELDDAKEEAEVIRQLLDAGVVVHRSLGDSRYDYASQRLDTLSGRTVVTIEGTQISLVIKAEKWMRDLKQRRAARRERP